MLCLPYVCESSNCHGNQDYVGDVVEYRRDKNEERVDGCPGLAPQRRHVKRVYRYSNYDHQNTDYNTRVHVPIAPFSVK